MRIPDDSDGVNSRKESIPILGRKESRGLEHSWMRRIANVFFRYDFFISYHWGSSGLYAESLAVELRSRGFVVFLDRENYAHGDDWEAMGRIELDRSQQLILLATYEAVFKSIPVRKEIVYFSGTKRQIVPIVFGCTLSPEENAPEGCSEQVWKRISGSSVLQIVQPVGVQLDEAQPNIPSFAPPEKNTEFTIVAQRLPNKPSPQVIDEIVKSYRVLRRRQVEIGWLGCFIAIVVGLMCFAVYSWHGALVFQGVATARSEEQQEIVHANLLEEALRNARRGDIEQAERSLAKLHSELPSAYQSEPETRYVKSVVDKSKPTYLEKDAQGFFEEPMIRAGGGVVGLIHRISHREWERPQDWMSVNAKHRGRGNSYRQVTENQNAQYDSDSLKVFRTADGKLLMRINLNQEFRGYQLSSDGQWCAAKEGNSAVAVWDLATGGRKRRFNVQTAHRDKVVGFAFTPDGKSIIARMVNGQLLKLTIATGEISEAGVVPADRYDLFRRAHSNAQSSFSFLSSDYYRNGELSYPFCVIDAERVLVGDLGPLFERPSKDHVQVVNLKDQRIIGKIPLSDDEEWKEKVKLEVAGLAKIVLLIMPNPKKGINTALYDMTGKLLSTLNFPPETVLGDLSPNGVLPSAIESGDSIHVSINDLRVRAPSKEIVLSKPIESGVPTEGAKPRALKSIVLNQALTLAALTYSDTVDLFDLSSRSRIRSDHLTDTSSISFSESGEVALLRRTDSASVVDCRSNETRLSHVYDESLVCWDLSQSGSVLATCHSHGKIRLWDVGVGEKTCESQDVLAEPLGTLFSGDEQRVVVWNERCIRLYDTITGLPLAEFDEWSGPTTKEEFPSLRLTPDGESFVARSDDHIFVLDSHTLEVLFKTQRAVACDNINNEHDAALVFFESKSNAGAGQFQAWDTFTRREIDDVQVSDPPAAVLRRDASGPIAVANKAGAVKIRYSSSMDDQTIEGPPHPRRIHSTSDASIVAIETNDELFVNSRFHWPIKIPYKNVRVTEDVGMAMMWSGDSSTLSFWDLSSGEERRSFANVSPLEDCRFLGAGGSDILMNYETAAGRQLVVRTRKSLTECEVGTTAHEGEPYSHEPPEVVFCCMFSTEGDRLLLTDDKFTVTDWTINEDGFTFKKHQYLGRIDMNQHVDDADRRIGHFGQVLGIAVRPRYREFATTGMDNTVQIWSLDPPQRRTQLPQKVGLSGAYRYAIAYDPKGEYLLISDNREKQSDALTPIPQTIRVFNADTCEYVGKFAGHDDVIWSFSFNHDGTQLISCGQDGVVRVWDFTKVQLRSSVSAEETFPESLILSTEKMPDWSLCAKFLPGESQIISGGKEGLLRIYNSKTGTLERTLSGHQGSVTRICIGKDGKRVITACGDGMIRVWNLREWVAEADNT